MVQITGKYELIENKNFYEMLLKYGYTEENAKKANDTKSTLDVEVNGNKFKLISDAYFNKNENELIFNQEVDEKLSVGIELKSTATQTGNVVKIVSKFPDGSPGGDRVLTFSDAGLEMKITTFMEDAPTAIRTYKRV